MTLVQTPPSPPAQVPWQSLAPSPKLEIRQSTLTRPRHRAMMLSPSIHSPQTAVPAAASPVAMHLPTARRQEPAMPAPAPMMPESPLPLPRALLTRYRSPRLARRALPWLMLPPSPQAPPPSDVGRCPSPYSARASSRQAEAGVAAMISSSWNYAAP